MDLVHGRHAFGFAVQAGPDHRLHQPVDLDSVAALVNPRESEPADLADQLPEHDAFLQPVIQQHEGPYHLVAVQEPQGDGLGSEEGAQLQQPGGRRRLLAQPVE